MSVKLTADLRGIKCICAAVSLKLDIVVTVITKKVSENIVTNSGKGRRWQTDRQRKTFCVKKGLYQKN